MSEKRMSKAACVSADTKAVLNPIWMLASLLFIIGLFYFGAVGAFTAAWWIADNWELIIVFILICAGLLISILGILFWKKKC